MALLSGLGFLVVTILIIGFKFKEKRYQNDYDWLLTKSGKFYG
jgi:hypothetical protein